MTGPAGRSTLEGYEIALLDWLACASRGREEPTARAAAALEDRTLHAATAGHVLDFDDTFLPGIAHLSAPVAPAALVAGAELGRSAGEVLSAYALGFEAMGALARASHPALYDHGWHPTAVCGVVGAAVAAAELLEAPRDHAIALSLLRSGGLRAAFGSAGKSLQVGFAAQAGLQAARLAAAGASAPLARVARGWEEATSGTFTTTEADGRAIEHNWIKAWPCCLQTHGAIEAAATIRGRAPRRLTVSVHPVSLQAASEGPEPRDGLQAKFSIPYLTAYTLLHGPPTVESFDRVDAEAMERARGIEVRSDRDLLESEFVLAEGGEEIAHVKAALGSPRQPMDEAALERKRADLTGPGQGGFEADEPAEALLRRFGL